MEKVNNAEKLDGYGDYEICEDCQGAGSYSISVPIKWTTIKEIYKKSVELLGEEYESSNSNRIWVYDQSRPISSCCHAPVEKTLLPERLSNGRKPCVKALYRCSNCKRSRWEVEYDQKSLSK